ncbi:type II toxin-antitoxin system Phd/YefM family antitoxin [Bifidobacterium mongoliense]|uniref:Antitoxin n=1 Tax=Bifidobacterium mongoliense TaxID=518643 RepID=A0A423UCX8_9BIFI|nr:type II toxin-antitoxin system prevent-host-death family antitoxin [Bifidobacterium mongoliense]ROT86586.1 prevent-host-death protein [Bifidobacterium mongoliense]
MFTLPYTTFRRSMKETMRRIHDDADVMLVTNRDPADNVVVMSQDDYESLMETLRVQSNPDLHRRVLSGMRQSVEGTEEEYDEL